MNQTGYNLIGWGLLLGGWIIIFILSAIGAVKVHRFLKQRQSLGNAFASTPTKSNEKKQDKAETEKSPNIPYSINTEPEGPETQRLKTLQEVEMTRTEPKGLNSVGDLNLRSPLGSEILLNPEKKNRHRDSSDPSSHLDVLPTSKMDDDSTDRYFTGDKKNNKKDASHTARTKGNLLQIDENDHRFDFDEFINKQGTSRPY